jgi:hypothetical protein
VAVGTVSGVSPEDQWQLIATNSPSAATSSSFTSISGYKQLRIAYKLTSTANGIFGYYLQFNSDSTMGNYGSVVSLFTSNQVRNGDRMYISGYTETNASAGYATILDADKTTPKTLGAFGSQWSTAGSGVWMGSSAISSILFSNDSGTFTGTIYLYGIPA